MLAAVVLLVIAVIQSQALAPPRESRASTGTAAISGRITDQGTALPLPRIVVSLIAADRRTPLKAITNDEGRYELTGLAAGKYILMAAPDEHRSTYLPQRFGETDPASPLDALSRSNIELKPGEVRSGVDIALSRALAIEGRVLDPWDEPMAEMEIVVSRADGVIVLARPAYSDDLGAYRVFGLAPGRYRVCARVRGRESPEGARFVRTCHQASLVEREASDVILTSQDASGIDIRVQRVGSSSISGSVLDAAGAPVDGAGVVASALDDSGIASSGMSRGGDFMLKGLTPGRYVIKASIGGPRRGDPGAPSREQEIGYASADLGTVDTTGVTVTLSKAAAVAGRVTLEGSPAPRANALRMVVQTRLPNDRWYAFESRPPFSAVDDNLRFELKGLYRLPVAVGIQDVPDGWVLKSVQYEGRDIRDVATDFGSASASSRLEIVLTNRVAHPSVRVIDAQGVPLTSYGLVAVRADPSRWRLSLGGSLGTPTSDGVLKLGAVLPGDYIVAALTTNDYLTVMRDRARIDSLATVATRVRFEEGDAGTIELRLIKLPPAQ